MNRRRGQLSKPIAADAYRTVTFRCGATGYNWLVAEAGRRGVSVSAIVEELAESAAGSGREKAAEDRMRVIAREEIEKAHAQSAKALADGLTRVIEARREAGPWNPFRQDSLGQQQPSVPPSQFPKVYNY